VDKFKGGAKMGISVRFFHS